MFPAQTSLMMNGEFPEMRTSTHLEGPCLMISAYPPGSTPEQAKAAFDAAKRVFDEAGVDPVDCRYSESKDRPQLNYLSNLWDEAEHAATIACWAPREGTPEPTKIEIFID
jgi:hypothetical protein